MLRFCVRSLRRDMVNSCDSTGLADATKKEKMTMSYHFGPQHGRMRDLKGLKIIPELALSPRQVCNASVM